MISLSARRRVDFRTVPRGHDLEQTCFVHITHFFENVCKYETLVETSRQKSCLLGFDIGRNCFYGKDVKALLPFGSSAQRIMSKRSTTSHLYAGLALSSPHIISNVEEVRYYYDSLINASLTKKLHRKKTCREGVMLRGAEQFRKRKNMIL